LVSKPTQTAGLSLLDKVGFKKRPGLNSPAFFILNSEKVVSVSGGMDSCKNLLTMAFNKLEKRQDWLRVRIVLSPKTQNITALWKSTSGRPVSKNLQAHPKTTARKRKVQTPSSLLQNSFVESADRLIIHKIQSDLGSL